MFKDGGIVSGEKPDFYPLPVGGPICDTANHPILGAVILLHPCDVLYGEPVCPIRSIQSEASAPVIPHGRDPDASPWMLQQARLRSRAPGTITWPSQRAHCQLLGRAIALTTTSFRVAGHSAATSGTTASYRSWQSSVGHELIATLHSSSIEDCLAIPQVAPSQS